MRMGMDAGAEMTHAEEIDFAERPGSDGAGFVDGVAKGGKRGRGRGGGRYCSHPRISTIDCTSYILHLARSADGGGCCGPSTAACEGLARARRRYVVGGGGYLVSAQNKGRSRRSS